MKNSDLRKNIQRRAPFFLWGFALVSIVMLETAALIPAFTSADVAPAGRLAILGTVILIDTVVAALLIFWEDINW